MSEIMIRPAVATDVNTLIAIDHSSQTDYVWQVDQQREDTQSIITFREIRLPKTVTINYPRLVSILAETWRRQDGFFVAVVENTVIGYVRTNEANFQPTASITDLVVTPRYRRQGVGEKLIKAVKTMAVNRKNTYILLEMISKNVPAIRFARKLGFEFSGYNDKYYDSKDIALFFGHSIG